MKIFKMPKVYVTFDRKINKIPEFYIARKINKVPEFYMIDRLLAPKARILHDNCPKNIFPDFCVGMYGVPPLPRLLRQCSGK